MNLFPLNVSIYLVMHTTFVKQWLIYICPFKENGRLTTRQHRLTCVSSSQRQCVEQPIGHLKDRFRRLREIPMYSPKDICTLIVAACIMHNLCVKAHDNVDEYIVSQDIPPHPNNYPSVFASSPDVFQTRNATMNTLPLLQHEVCTECD